MISNRKVQSKFKTSRKNIRFNVNDSITYTLNRNPVKCSLVNISDSGIMIKTNQVLVIGDILNINLSCYFRTLNIKAEVKHVNYQFVGLKFLLDNNDENNILIIKDYISHKFDKNYKAIQHVSLVEAEV